ncbi:MAG: glycosyltransferase family 4 protein [Anaerolineales bacterium]|nr:glycosyltransferase family 4 protein [Anaerolineales bacterium]
MRILVLTYEFPPVGGGGGRVAQDICQGLAQQGHEITVITSHQSGLPRDEMLTDVRIIRVPSFRRETFRAGLLTMGAYIFSGFWAGLRLASKWRPDVLHVHFAVPSGALAWLISRITGIPYILTAHLGDVPGGAPEKTDKWFRWIFPFTRPIWHDAAQVVAVSEFTKQLALRHYPVDIRVIYNGVDLKKLQPVEIQVQEPPRIIFAGRFMMQKNPVQIVRILASIKEIEWQCVMLGDGPLYNDVRQEIKNQALQDRFLLPGWVTSDEVINWFSKSDILFMPSRSEGLPVVGVQALAMGLAMVVSDIGGFIDLINNEENGFLIELKNADMFTQRLTELLVDPQKLHAFRNASRKKALEFDMEHVIQQYLQSFNKRV